jgi:periplasmic copper chaperone A
MRIINLSILVLSLLWLLPTLALAHDGVHITDPYLRITASNGAAFMLLENHAEVPDFLLSATSPAAETIQLMEHAVDADGLMTMRILEAGIAIDPGAQVALDRGGLHLMLVGLTGPLKDGDMVPMTLTFDHAGVITIDVVVDNQRKPGPMPHADHTP